MFGHWAVHFEENVGKSLFYSKLEISKRKSNAFQSHL